LLLLSFKKDKKKSIESLALALAGTLGVGNITGVGMGIIIGGSGSIFWLFISSIFSSVLKYSETVLSIDALKNKSGGGMMRVIKSSFKRLGAPLSIVYAICCVFLALTMGSALQSNAVSDSAIECGVTPALPIAIFVFITIFAIVKFGIKMEKITAIIIPLTTILYILLSFWVIIANISKLPYTVSLILKSAFTPDSMGGGIMAFLLSKKLSEGYARGILSNEAGAGTSSLAHIKNSDADPVSQGLIAMCEVFFDSTLLCTLTALVILLSVPDPTAFQNGAALVSFAFKNSLGDIAPLLLLLMIFLFAISTSLCWYYYGRASLEFVFNSYRAPWFELLFILSLILGAVFDSIFIISFTDALLLVLALLSLSAIIKGSDRIIHLSERSGLINLKHGYGCNGRRR
jgi:AGCS family alanine or glycine:cation symporter